MMANDADRKIVRETCEALKALNVKLVECKSRGIAVEIFKIDGGTAATRTGAYLAEFTRTEKLYP